MPICSSSTLYRLGCSRLKSTHTASGVRVRFAPSPTGKMHLGGLRIALYNFLFSRSHNGSFIVRIEDTDQQRIVPGAARQIEGILDHFELYRDEGPSKGGPFGPYVQSHELYRDEGPSKGGPFGPYVQSHRLNTYVEAAERLIDAGHAYRCFCSQERLKMLRREALRRRETPRYDNLCRGLSREETAARMRDGIPSVVRFKMEQTDITFQDEVFGIISQIFDEGDFVLLKSDSYPTYHMANVVDDHAMRISHVIRGMEWISSTPKHVQLYRAFDWEQPLWIHLPLITRDGSRKLSKRDEVVDFLWNNEEGFAHISQLSSGQFKFFFSLASDTSKVLDVFDADLAFRLLSEIRNHENRSLESLRRLASERNVSYPQLLRLIRLTLIDAPSGPPIMELFEFFGSDECNKRFDGMMKMLAKSSGHASECE
uniref:Nondiscriminating glutamyl-tRNA synthetase EARS2, mitochondrial n=1 Tax=Ascaris lumbricoides TaxID=6252 RepID=A0A9J2PGM8_ASCLU